MLSHASLAKRKLTKQQQRRIAKLQKTHLGKQYSDNDEIHLASSKPGLVITQMGRNVGVEDEQGNYFHCHLRQNLEVVVPGDEVMWLENEDKTGTIVALQPRRSLLQRYDNFGRQKAVAANVTLMLITLTCKPELSIYMLDSYLAAAELSDIRAMIIFNKMDLLSSQQNDEYHSLLKAYEEIGYEVIFSSAKYHENIEAISKRIDTETSVFVGQSGVGKSSIMNDLLGTDKISTNAISERSELGQHTTTRGELYHMNDNTHIIDSPGVRDFGLGKVDASLLANAFKDFRPYLGTCKYRNCAHQHEPGCEIIKAVEGGNIASHRLENYLRLCSSHE